MKQLPPSWCPARMALWVAATALLALLAGGCQIERHDAEGDGSGNFLATVPALVPEPTAEDVPPEPAEPAPSVPAGAEDAEPPQTAPAPEPVRSPAEVLLTAEETPQDESEEAPPGTELHFPALEAAGTAEREVTLNFDQVDIKTVVKTVSQITGLNFLLDDAVRGQVTLISPTPVRAKEVYSVLESVLASKGYAAVPSGNMVKVLPLAEAVREPMLSGTGAEPADMPSGDTVMTQLIPLRYVRVEKIRDAVTQLASTGAKVITRPEANSLLVIGTAANIRHMASVIGKLDTPQARRQLAVYRLKHASARDLARQLERLLEAGLPQAEQGGGQPGRRGGAPAGPTPREVKTTILPDDRTNALIVMAAAPTIETVGKLVETLDVERARDSGNIRVVYLQHARAETLKASIEAAAAGLGSEAGENAVQPRVTADVPTNSLIVTASPSDYSVIADIIEKLDIAQEQVLVEMCIAEASEDATRDLGIEWATVDPPSDNMRGFGYTDFGLRLEDAAGTLEGLAVGAFKQGSEGDTKIAAIVKALERDSRVDILSKPLIVTSDNEDAEIFVGQDVPFVKQSRVTETDPATPTAIRTFEFKDVGIRLIITPHVSTGGIVVLEIESQFTAIVEPVTGLGQETPTTAKREAKTVVSIMSGATVVIGGLMRDDQVKSTSKVPLLGDLPVIGALFRRTRRTTQKTNLLLFISPHVLTSTEELAAASERKSAEADLSPEGPTE
ncbi:MAG: type II secretion system secretin GspD [Candidatus Brocadiia bacterium]